MQNYDGLWAGAWRSGTDAYYLWANVSEASFLAKWQELAAQNLQLIDMEAIPVAGTGGASSGVSEMKMMMGERFGASQLQIGGADTVAASQDQARVGQGGGSTPSVAASGGTGGGSAAWPLVVGAVMATSGAGVGWRQRWRSGPDWWSGWRRRARRGGFAGRHGGDGNRQRRRQRARHNERCRRAFRQQCVEPAQHRCWPPLTQEVDV